VHSPSADRVGISTSVRGDVRHLGETCHRENAHLRTDGRQPQRVVRGDPFTLTRRGWGNPHQKRTRVRPPERGTTRPECASLASLTLTMLSLIWTNHIEYRGTGVKEGKEAARGMINACSHLRCAVEPGRRGAVLSTSAEYPTSPAFESVYEGMAAAKVNGNRRCPGHCVFIMRSTVRTATNFSADRTDVLITLAQLPHRRPRLTPVPVRCLVHPPCSGPIATADERAPGDQRFSVNNPTDDLVRIRAVIRRASRIMRVHQHTPARDRQLDPGTHLPSDL